ncbi:DUF2058 family protein, partial [Escherichia coli]|uniref:DUF2058 family protein n=1 Tax=Escherichia coli TaxID=562 RepID=UPI00281414A8
ASVADKIAQRDASSIVLHSALSAEEQDEDDPYADFKVPDDLILDNAVLAVWKVVSALFGVP